MRLLIIDDSPEDREYLMELARVDDDQSIIAFPTAHEGLEHLRQFGADCVLLDYRLGADDGIDVLATLKEREPNCPVILLTGEGNEELAATSIKLGAADYLVKHRLTESSLRTAIRNAVSHSALIARIAEQEAARRDFLSILVHDLRAPLRNTQQLGKMAIDEIDGGDLEQAKEFLSSQAAVAVRANDLISSLERFALYDGVADFENVSLTRAAEAAKQNLATIISSRRARVQIGDLPSIDGDMAQLVQLFQNLIGNGLKYNKRDQPSVLVESKDDNGLVIVVKDNGIGIPKEHHRAVFAPLKRLWGPRDYDGTGLGLAICQKIVERHRGEIWCTSEEGEGSEFHMRFPATGS